MERKEWKEGKDFPLSILSFLSPPSHLPKCKLFSETCRHIGRTPENVKAAFDNSSYVVTAWKDEQLVGVGRTISDGLFYTGVYDVLVHPEHQRRGIGTKIMREILTHFAGTSFLLTTTENTDKFYERLGFRKTRNAMVIKRPTAE